MQENAGQVPLQAVLDAAIGFHQAGNLVEAEKHYRKVLLLDPRHSDAIHYLGVIAHQVGKNDVAIAMIGAAIQINGKQAPYYANLALAFNAESRFDDALDACDKAISLNSNSTGAYLSRGIALSALGRFEEAVSALAHAAYIAPNFAKAHFQLGLVLKSQGKLSEALEAFDTVVRIAPSNAQAHFCRAALLDHLGRFTESADAYSIAVRLDPAYSSAYCNLAEVLSKLSRFEEAVEAGRAAIAIKPDFSGAYLNLANALVELGRIDEALNAYNEAVRIQPDFAEAYSLLGVTLNLAERPLEALAACSEAIRLEPGNAQRHYYLANLLFDLDRLDDGLAACDIAIRLKPELAEAHGNRAVALRKLGRVEESLAASAKATRINPAYSSAHFNEAIARLLMGDFAVGLEKYEWRYRGGAKELKARGLPAPQWTGQGVNGLTVLLHAEQGLGDSIQFCRFAVMVKSRGARVVLEVPRHLLRLLAGLPGVDQFVATGDTLPVFDFHCPLMSLPYALRTTIDSIPAAIPYLHAQADAQEIWKARLGDEGFKIGIAWQGSPTAAVEHGRSAPLSCFEPLSKIPGVRLISLQKGYGTDQLNKLPADMRVETLGADFDSGADAFVDTAALMMSLDLVVTVDTAIGHLAGALGRPTWTLLQKVPHWVWMLERTDSPWYPSLRLFRQNERGNWPELFENVTQALIQQMTKSAPLV